jgi:hypothetical protein
MMREMIQRYAEVKQGERCVTPCFFDCFHVLSLGRQFGLCERSIVRVGNLVCTPDCCMRVWCVFAGVAVTGQWVCESGVFRWSWECRELRR